MFGGVCHLLNGNMFCGVYKDFLILRLSAITLSSQSAFLPYSSPPASSTHFNGINHLPLGFFHLKFHHVYTKRQRSLGDNPSVLQT